jgi:hemerythrin-like domain-containing protein
MPRAIEMMNNRQRAMARALLAMRTMARAALRSGNPPAFQQMRRLIGYIERFPQKTHQPAEEQHLFRAVLAREPSASRAVTRARRDHAACVGHFVRLQTALNNWERGDPAAGPEVALHADEYARFCRLHGRVETRDLVSVALKVLSADEWRAIERAYAAANDPLEASKSRQDCERALRSLKAT